MFMNPLLTSPFFAAMRYNENWEEIFYTNDKSKAETWILEGMVNELNRKLNLGTCGPIGPWVSAIERKDARAAVAECKKATNGKLVYHAGRTNSKQFPMIWEGAASLVFRPLSGVDTINQSVYDWIQRGVNHGIAR